MMGTRGAAENRKLMREFVDAVDAYEDSLAGCNPTDRARCMDAAYRAGAAAFAKLFHEAAMERAAAASVGREPTELEGVDPEALATAQAGIDRRLLQDRDRALGCRNILARLILDFAGLLPPGLAVQAAAGLHQLNLGNALPLFEPYRVQGRSPVAARKVVAQLAVYSRIYYRMGYFAVSKDAAIAAEADAVSAVDAERLNADKIDKFAQRQKFRAVFDWNREQGELDRMEGRRFSPPFATDYSLAQLIELTKAGRG